MTTKPLSQVLNEYPQLVGPTGPTGPAGAQGPQGPPGADGTNGQGVPTGGTTGQMLAKMSGTNYDTNWVDPPSGGGSLAWTLAASWTYSGVAADPVSFTDLGTPGEILIVVDSANLNFASNFQYLVSTDNGVTWVTSGYHALSDASQLGSATKGTFLGTSSNTNVRSYTSHIMNLNGCKKPVFTAGQTNNGTAFIDVTGVINAVQVGGTSVQMNAGSIYIYTR